MHTRFMVDRPGTEHREEEKNRLVESGDWVRAVADFAAEDFEVQVDDAAPIVGRESAVDHQRELSPPPRIRLLEAAASATFGFSLWELEREGPGGVVERLRQVALRRWRGGQLLRERILHLRPGPEAPVAESAAPSVAAQEAALNELICGGHFVEATRRYCAESIVMQENGEAPRVGLEANLAFERAIEDAVDAIEEISCSDVAVDGNVSYSTWRFRLLMKDGSRFEREQVALRRWADGKLVYERFFYSG